MIVLLIVISCIAVVVSVQHSKSYYIENDALYVNAFAFDGLYVYIPVKNAIAQRSFESTEVVRTLTGHSSGILDLFLYNGTLVSGSSDGLLVQWDLNSGAILNRLETKCDLSRMALFFNKCLISCIYSVSKIVNLDTFQLESWPLDSIDNIYFYAYGDVAYGYFNGPGIISYQRNFTSRIIYHDNLISAMVREDDNIFAANKATFQILQISAVTGETVRFSGQSHNAVVSGMCICNGYLVSGANEFQMILWNITSKTRIKSIISNQINMILPYNSTSIWVADSANSVYLFDIITWSKTKTFEGNRIYLTSLAIYDNFVFSGSTSNELKKWSISTREVQKDTLNNSYSPSIYIDKNHLFCCRQSILVFDLLTSAVIKEFAKNDANCLFAFFYFKGFVYATSSLQHNVVNKYNLTDTSVVLKFVDARVAGGCLGIFAQVSYLFVNYLSSIYAQWDLNTGALQRIYTAYNVIYYTAYENNVLVSNGALIFMTNPSQLQTTSFYSPGFVSGCLNYDASSGILFVVGMDDSIIHGLDVSNNFNSVYRFQGHTNRVYVMIINGDSLFSSSEDGTVKQWSLTTKRIVYSFEDRTRSVTSLVCFDDRLVFGTIGGNIYEFAISTAFLNSSLLMQKSVTDIVHNNGLIFVALDDSILGFPPTYLSKPVYNFPTISKPQTLFVSSSFLYSGHIDFSIVQWNYTSGAQLKTFLGHAAIINDLLILGNKMFSAGSDSIIVRWSIVTMEIELKYEGHTDQVSSILVLNDILISSSYDKSIIFWKIKTGSVIKVLKRTPYIVGHLGPINQIKVCGGDLFSASSDLTIKRWDITTGSVLDTMFGHAKAVNYLYCYNNALFSGSEDFAVFLWYPSFQVASIQKTSILSVRTLPSLVVSARSSSQSNVLNFLYILIGFVLLCLICIVTILYYKRKQSFKLKQTTEADYSSSTATQHSEFTINAETLFTHALGISIPGYLEFNATSFRLLKQIARGGGGSIYLAEIFGKKDKYIAKLYSDNYSQKNELMKTAFDQEVTLMEYLKPHKNIAKIVGFCKNPYALLMKYYELGSFKNLINSGAVLTLFEVTKYLGDISKGIQYMHSKNIIHNDLKPDNVLVDTDEYGMFMVLADFGISHIIGTENLSSNQFKIANLKGLSVCYAAPELFERFKLRLHEKDGKSAKGGDLYAFGSTVYEAVTRIAPWR